MVPFKGAAALGPQPCAVSLSMSFVSPRFLLLLDILYSLRPVAVAHDDLKQ